MNNHRVLFLDVDGVLHPAPEPGRRGLSDLRAQVGPLGWLEHLAAALAPHPDVQVVVHSSWRETFRLDELADMLAELGARSVDVAPPGPRWNAIQAWLAAHRPASHCILDDEAGEFPAPPPNELLLCNPRQGVSAPELLERLGLWLEQSRPDRRSPSD